VDSERAETYLRLLAERELRRALAQARTAPARPADPAANTEITVVNRVARALITVGALDAGSTGAIQEDLALALRFRLDPAKQWWPRRPVGRRSAVGGQPTAVPPQVVAVRFRLPIPDGSLRVLSYARTGSGCLFTVVARLRRRALSGITHPLSQFTATDDTGTSYRLRFSATGGGPDDYDGQLILVPEPPPGLRWLEITGPGMPGRRVDLIAGREPDCLVTPASLSVGEQLLNTIAVSLLTALPDFPPEVRRKIAAASLGLSIHAATSLGDIVAGLESAGALSPDSPLPGQLAALCEGLAISDHGVTGRPALELPGPWESLLAHYLRRMRDPAPPNGCAGIALTLPEVDGIVFAVLGLHNTDGISMLHVHASGLPPGRGGLLPVIWLRDSAGRWHVTSASPGPETGGEATMRVVVVPPVARTTWIEVVVAGRTAQARATVPLRWGDHRG
jgi:hypothetical protein